MSWLIQLLDKNSPNPSTRLELSEQIIDQLSHNRLPSDSKTLNNFCDVIFQWMSASNFKVALQAIEVLNTALDISGDVLSPYLLERAPALIERLGDSKPQVRDAVTNLLIDLSNLPHCSHQVVLEKVSPGFGHKQWLVKCATMNVYRLLLDEAREELEPQTNRLVPLLCKLMADPNNDVRETSMHTIVHVMIILGESVAVSIRNRRLIPDSKMQLLMQRYEDALKRGSIPSAVPRPIRAQRRFEPRAQSASVTRNGSTNSLGDDQENFGGARKSMMAKKPFTSNSRPAGAAGTVTEDEIKKSFGDVPKITIANRNDIRSHLDNSRAILEKTETDWSKRNNALKIVRAVVLNGGLDFEPDLISALLIMEEGLTKSVVDLRSQVCKEACITLCLLCERLGNKLSQLIERIFPHCIPLIQNSAKVMASSSQQVCDFIVKNVQSPRILQSILDFISHKSKEIRSHCYRLICLVLEYWPKDKLDKQIKDIVNAIKCGISDADPTARKNGRDSYHQLDIAFPTHAQALFKTLDSSKQKALSGAGSAASSAQSIPSLRDSLPISKRPGTNAFSRPSAFLSGRSASAIDTSSVRTAVATTPKHSMQRNPITPVRNFGGSIRTPSSNVKPRTGITASTYRMPSQPNSRSGSPTRLTARPPIKVNNTASNHNNGVRHEEQEDLFNKINNLSLTYGEDEDFLLGSGGSTSPTSQLNNALKRCASNDPLEKKEGLKMIQELLPGPTRVSDEDIRKIAEIIMKFLVEGNHKILPVIADTVSEVVMRYPSSFSPQQILTLISRLIAKSSQELIPTNQTLWKRMLKDVRESFSLDILLAAVCKYVDGSMTTPQTPKAKSLTVQYLYEIVSAMDAGANINKIEVKAALSKIFQWNDDLKNTEIRPHFERLMNALFNANQADFVSMLSTFKPEWKDLGLQYCRKANGRQENLESSPFQREKSVPLSGLDSMDSYKKNLAPSLGPIFNTSDSDTNRSNLDETSHLAGDEISQTLYIKKQLQELAMAKSNPQRQDEQILAMQQLLQMVSEGSFTTWEDNFKLLIVQLFDILTIENTKVKKEALRLLTKLCTVQATRFFDYGQMTINKVLATTVSEKDSWFLNVIDDCLKTLASHLPIDKTLSTLNPIIATKTDGRILYSLKMIQRMVESWDIEQIRPFLKDFAPGVVQCYNCTDSSVRKNTIFCLVALVNKFGRETMDQFLINLESKGLKLLDVYVQRNQTASTHF